jgi:hypothetical protein
MERRRRRSRPSLACRHMPSVTSHGPLAAAGPCTCGMSATPAVLKLFDRETALVPRAFLDGGPTYVPTDGPPRPPRPRTGEHPRPARAGWLPRATRARAREWGRAARCPLPAARCPLPAARCPLPAARCPLLSRVYIRPRRSASVPSRLRPPLCFTLRSARPASNCSSDSAGSCEQSDSAPTLALALPQVCASAVNQLGATCHCHVPLPTCGVRAAHFSLLTLLLDFFFTFHASASAFTVTDVTLISYTVTEYEPLLALRTTTPEYKHHVLHVEWCDY